MMPTEKPRRRRGCLFWGGIVAAILLLFALLAGYAGYRYIRHLAFEYTDTKSIEMPAVHLSGAEITNLQQRIENFEKAVKENKSVEPLILTADEINALIANAAKTNSSSASRLNFSFNDDQVHAQLSVRMDTFGWRLLKGRYFNGSGVFALSLHDGRLSLRVKSLEVKGKPLPEQFMQSVRAQNFADSWTNNPDFDQTVMKLKEIKIENEKLIVIPKAAESQPEPKLESAK